MMMSRSVTRRSCTQMLALSPLLVAGAVKAAPLLLVEGQHYTRVTPPVPVTTGAKIEVLECFSYGCVHCYNFESVLDIWRPTMPKDAKMAFLPATFNSNFEMYARGYYAAEALGVAAKLHRQVFDSVWKNQLVVNDMDALANLYLRLGVPRDKFLAAVNSPGVAKAVTTATAKADKLKMDSTPTLYVDGKYLLLMTGAANYGEVMQRLDGLIAMARVARK
jgi:thiol:disulfide interchange protein DsbA